MARISALVTAAFLAGPGLGFATRRAALAAPRQKVARSADVAAIQKLHRADEECTLTRDPKCLTALWADDGVSLGFSGPPVVGIKAMRGAYAKFRAEHPYFRVLKDTTDITALRIVDVSRASTIARPGPSRPVDPPAEGTLSPPVSRG